MELQKELEKQSFAIGSKFEYKGNQLIIRNKDRTTLQEKLETYLLSKKIKYTVRRKTTELDVMLPAEKKGQEDKKQTVIFKPMAAKGVGGLKFEAAFIRDMDNWFKGAEYNELEHGDTIEGLVKLLKLPQNSRWKCKPVGAANTRRPPAFTATKCTVKNNNKGNVSDVDILNATGAVAHHCSLKFSKSFYIYNATVIDLFKSPSEKTRAMINNFFGFDGDRMEEAFGKEFAAKTNKTKNFSLIGNRFADIIKQALGPDIVLVSKIKQGVNHLSNIKGLGHRVSISGLTKDSYGYAEKGVRKYNFINMNGKINGHSYQVQFQFRGTTAIDTGPRYLRVLLKADPSGDEDPEKNRVIRL